MAQQQVSHLRNPDEAELSQFYFLAHLPGGLEKGAVVLQRRGRYGIRTALLGDFGEYLKQRHPAIVLEINPLFPDDLLEKYLARGRLLKYRLIKHQRTSDIADSHYARAGRERSDKLELHVSTGTRLLGIPQVVHDIARKLRPASAISEILEDDIDSPATP